MQHIHTHGSTLTQDNVRQGASCRWQEHCIGVVLAVTVARLATIDAVVWAKSCHGVVSVLAEHKAALLLLLLLLLL